MSNTLYGRRLRVNIGGRLVDESLRVVFSITRDISGDMNSADISLYNLSPHTRAAVQRKGVALRVEAGYKDNISSIFLGKLMYAATVRKGPDVITSLQALDGPALEAKARMSATWGEGTSAAEVANHLVGASGLKDGNIVETIKASGRVLADAFSTKGDPTDSLEEMLNDQDKSMFTDNGSLYALPRNTPIAPHLATVLGRRTGLIGEPSIGENGAVSFSALLQPELAPGKAVKIDLPGFGFYRVDSVAFAGDTFGDDWYANCEGTPV